MPSIPDDLVSLKPLWKVAERAIPLVEREKPDYALEWIGLGLRNLTNAGYYCTPINSSTFASTGGDGVHFGLVHVNGKPSELSPIVMTVPLGITENVIVGSNLIDFLRVGCASGYANLEELAYVSEHYFAGQWVDYRKNYDRHRGSWVTTDDEDQDLLELIRQEFGLVPHEDLRGHLDRLKAEFMPLIQLPDKDRDQTL